MATINRKVRQYSDINLLFTTSSVTADITKKVDEEAVKASIKNLIQTRNFERPFHPEIGSQVFALLFENYTPITAQVMRKTIFDVIEKFEPRATLLDVRIQENQDANSLNIDVIFRINNNERPITLKTILQRVR